MSKDLNLCQFIGRFGKPPEMAATNAGKSVAKFSIACGDDYKDKQGAKVEQTNWIDVVAFDRLAEIIGQYCDKGSKVYISGKQITRKWQDKQGNDRYSTEIVVNNMQLLDGRSTNPQSSELTPRANPQSQPGNDFVDDNLPF